MKVKISDIIDAMEMTDEYTEYFIDRETGEIEFINEMVMDSSEKEEISERLDEHGFYRLPTQFDIHDHEIMEDFVNRLKGDAHDQLSSAIQGRGAFRRFKDGIIRLGIDQLWFDFRDSAYRRKAIECCEEEGIEYEE